MIVFNIQVQCIIALYYQGGDSMEKGMSASRLTNNFGVSLFSQSYYYFSFGYFALPKTEYESDCWQSLSHTAWTIHSP